VLALEVRADGRGFNPQEIEDARREGRFGLTGIRERAARMGSHCDLRPQPAAARWWRWNYVAGRECSLPDLIAIAPQGLRSVHAFHVGLFVSAIDGVMF
jgi:hypothetical protein